MPPIGCGSSSEPLGPASRRCLRGTRDGAALALADCITRQSPERKEKPGNAQYRGALPPYHLEARHAYHLELRRPHRLSGTIPRRRIHARGMGLRRIASLIRHDPEKGDCNARHVDVTDFPNPALYRTPAPRLESVQGGAHPVRFAMFFPPARAGRSGRWPGASTGLRNPGGHGEGRCCAACRIP